MHLLAELTKKSTPATVMLRGMAPKLLIASTKYDTPEARFNSCIYKSKIFFNPHNKCMYIEKITINHTSEPTLQQKKSHPSETKIFSAYNKKSNYVFCKSE